MSASPASEQPREAPPKRRFRFGLRKLLAAMLLLALLFGWIGRHHHLARQREMLLAELAQRDVHARLTEPTGVAFWIKKRVPSLELWLRKRIGDGWFSRPTVVALGNLDDGQVAEVVDRLARLKSVREAHYDDRGLSEQGAAEFSRRLPEVNLERADNLSEQSYYQGFMNQREHFAAAILPFIAAEVLILLGLVGVMIAVVVKLIYRFSPKSKGGRATPPGQALNR